MELTEVDTDPNCSCHGCLLTRRRVRRRPAARVHPAARAAVLVAAVGTALGGAAPTASAAPRFSATQRAATPREEILQRAQRWVDQKVPYSMTGHWSDGYRQDCSGFVSMAWGLGTSETTWTLPAHADRIVAADLQPGDALILNNPNDPAGGSHVVLFAGWLNSAHSQYMGYEQTKPHAMKRSIPYAYWRSSDGFAAYRYRGAANSHFPGADRFRPGAHNDDVTSLGRMLAGRGGARFYSAGPGPDWNEADRRATAAFQRAQGWRGKQADGYPGPDTWDRLTRHRGNDIPGGVLGR